MNLNKVFLLGRLTADPVSRTTPSGQQVATFSVATNRVWYDKQNGKKEDVQFHNIVVWGRQADVAQRFLTKGGVVFIEGRLQTRAWDDKQGQKRRTTEVIAESLQLGPRPAGMASGASPFPSSAPSGGFAPQAAVPEMPTIELDADMPAPEPPSGADGVNPEDLNF
jgi:single-strand DNA-binding protein